MKTITLEIPDTAWAIGVDVVYVDDDGINKFKGFVINVKDYVDGEVISWEDITDD